jgi:hypothetical protein
MDIYTQYHNLMRECVVHKTGDSCAIVCGGKSAVQVRETYGLDLIAVNSGGFVDPRRTKFWFFETVDQLFTSGDELSAAFAQSIQMAAEGFSGKFLFNPAQPGAGQLSNMMWAGIERLGVPRLLYQDDKHGSVCKMQALAASYREHKVEHPVIHCAGSLSLAASFAVLMGYREISVYGADFNNDYFFQFENTAVTKVLRQREGLLLSAHDRENRKKHESAMSAGSHPVDTTGLVATWGQIPISQFMALLIDSTSQSILWRWCSTGNLRK